MLSDLKQKSGQKITETSLILSESLKSFRRNNNLSASASLAYYGLFALVPLFLLVIFLLGNYIISSDAAIRGIETLSSRLLPEFHNTLMNEIYYLAVNKNLWGFIGIAGLFWTVMPLAGAIRSAFAKIFITEEGPAFLKAKFLNVLAVAALLLTFIFLVTGEIVYSHLVSMHLKKLPALFRITDIVAPMLITALFMSVFYFIFSPVKLRLPHLIAGATASAALWAIVSPAFTFFMTFNPQFGIAFGSLKAVFILLIWVYYSFAVILFGAEVISNSKRKDILLLKGMFLGKARKGLITRFMNTCGSGETVFKEGGKGNDMFYVLSGSVAISRHGQILRMIKQGEYFGEMSMLLNAPRTADAVAAENGTQLISISKNNFENILREEPKIVISILKEMALRLKTTNEYL
ncbi:MAG: YihY family inner membrane protein [Nitrospirae bacterium]|nr:YihY family inner membrane protein [Nitrospirota bacterium]